MNSFVEGDLVIPSDDDFVFGLMNSCHRSVKTDKL